MSRTSLRIEGTAAQKFLWELVDILGRRWRDNTLGLLEDLKRSDSLVALAILALGEHLATRIEKATCESTCGGGGPSDEEAKAFVLAYRAAMGVSDPILDWLSVRAGLAGVARYREKKARGE